MFRKPSWLWVALLASAPGLAGWDEGVAGDQAAMQRVAQNEETDRFNRQVMEQNEQIRKMEEEAKKLEKEGGRGAR